MSICELLFLQYKNISEDAMMKLYISNDAKSLLRRTELNHNEIEIW